MLVISHQIHFGLDYISGYNVKLGQFLTIPYAVINLLTPSSIMEGRWSRLRFAGGSIPYHDFKCCSKKYTVHFEYTSSSL